MKYIRNILITYILFVKKGGVYGQSQENRGCGPGMCGLREL